MDGLLQHLFQFLWRLWRRPLSPLRRGRYEREMEEEMRFHLETQIEQYLASRMAAEEARYAARQQSGARQHPAEHRGLDLRIVLS